MFKVGDRVHIKTDSPYHDIGWNNPASTVLGRVASVSKSQDHPVIVDWDNGSHNCYYHNDLCLVVSAENIVQTDSESYSRSRKIKKEDKAIIKAYLDSL